MNYQGPLYAPHPDIMRDYPLYKLSVWNNTHHGHIVYPVDRCDYNTIQNKVTQFMHQVMHSPNEIVDDQY